MQLDEKSTLAEKTAIKSQLPIPPRVLASHSQAFGDVPFLATAMQEPPMEEEEDPGTTTDYAN